MKTYNKIPENLVTEMLILNLEQVSITYDMFKDNLVEMEDEDDIYMFSFSLSTLYAGFINYPIITLQLIAEKNLFNNLINWTEFMTKLKFFSTYQSKVK
jgi:hypothetical protein